MRVELRSRARSYALIQLLLHFWLVAVFPVGHSVSEAHLVLAVQSVTGSQGADRAAGDAPAEQVVSEPAPEEAPHDLPCVFCRVLTSSLLSQGQPVHFPGGREAAVRSELPVSEPPCTLLPPSVARGPPALIG